MTLEQFYELNKSGTRVYKDDEEMKIDQFTKCYLFDVIWFVAICDDLIEVHVEWLYLKSNKIQKS